MFKMSCDVSGDSREGEAGEFHLCCLCAKATQYNTFCASAILLVMGTALCIFRGCRIILRLRMALCTDICIERAILFYNLYNYIVDGT